MARKHRLYFPGAVYHVIVRGNAGEDIFFSDLDRYRLYLFLQHAVEEFECRIHGFCLMTNHIHLVMQTGGVSLSRIMQHISLRYTKWINYSRRRTGHIFQGRYKAVLVDADAYLLELVRYVHLNPVRAGLTKTVGEWRWSGHCAYAGMEIIPWLATEPVLSMFSGDIKSAREAYAAFVNEGASEERRGEFHTGTWDGRLLGDDFFVDTALEKAGEEATRWQVTVSDVVDAVCRAYGCSLEELQASGKLHLFSEARAVASCIVQRFPSLHLTDLGKCVKRDIDSLGRAGRRLEVAAAKDGRLQQVLETVQKQVIESRKV